ncbi:MAG: bis(5'-nucleosyl)-tetraphosphatase (symmetrical) YqeK [Lachnospiraceae bacterium]|nr:bis(5'-nucleosyl)-tetraphosphatase (symmetrical) YqeK [Lachnospiraceae bacterium]
MKTKTPDRIELAKALEKELNYKRFIHTMGVAATASCMAMRWGADAQKAELAGLLHDCAKNLDLRKMLKICEDARVQVSEIERTSEALLHSKAGAVLAQTRYGVEDPEILGAIRCHTTGRPGMTLLEKILFIADYMEPGRDVAEDLPEVRRLAFTDLDACLLRILEDSLVYLETKGSRIDPMTESTCRYYQSVRDGREEHV